MVGSLSTCLFVLYPTFLSDFTQRCLSAPDHDSDAISAASTTTSLLKEWAKATLANRSWRDAVAVAVAVSISFCSLYLMAPTPFEFTAPRSVVYRTICECLEANGHTTGATECFQDMMGELGEEVYMNAPMTEWISGKFIFCLFFGLVFNLSCQILHNGVSPLPITTMI